MTKKKPKKKATDKNVRRPKIRDPRALSMGLVPIAVYFLLFVVTTFPLILDFSTHFFASGDRDGPVMIWGVWWTNEAVTRLHQSPFHTGYLHYPFGVSLLPHTLAPFAGFLAVLLLPFMSLLQAYNFIVVFSFVAGGLTTFWLSFHFTRSYWPSIVAGFIFSFSNYHFAHTPGHLNLVSLEWIPLFVLCWHLLMTRPGMAVALVAGVSLFAVVLCDYYYFFYCFLIALLMYGWHAVARRNAFFVVAKSHRVSFAAFALTSAVSSGLLLFRLSRVLRGEEWIGVHDPETFSTDLLAPFVYGACLRFSGLTKSVWGNFSGNTSENSVYMGVSVLILLVYAWLKRARLKSPEVRMWFAILLVFFVCSLGPTLHVLGKSVPWLPLPYSLLETVFPALKVSGVPVRMMAIVMLCAAVIGAMGLDLLLRSTKRARTFAYVLIAVLFIEFLPFHIRGFKPEVPQYVYDLKTLPHGAVIDGAAPDTYQAMYYQTIHEKPIALGKVARMPQTTYDQSVDIVRSVRQNDFQKLYRDYGFRYFVTKEGQVYDLSKQVR